MTPAEHEVLVGQRTHDDAVILAKQRAYWRTRAADPAAGTNGHRTRRQCLSLARSAEDAIILRATVVESKALAVTIEEFLVNRVSA